jgi:hypothetical protein
VLLASRAIYEEGSCFLRVQSSASLPSLLEHCLRATGGTEVQRIAFRLAYCYIFQFEAAFPKVSMLDLYVAAPNYSADSELGAGKDKTLDRICGFLVDGKPLLPPPTLDERSRSTEDEDMFFAQLAASASPLRNVRYERWLRVKAAARPVTALVHRLPFGIGTAFLEAGRGRWHSFLRRLEGVDSLEMVGQK